MIRRGWGRLADARFFLDAGGAAPAQEAAAALDLIYCLDWAYLEAERRRIRLPGLVHSKLIAQRRWALAWAVIFRGPYQPPPRGWEEIDLDI